MKIIILMTFSMLFLINGCERNPTESASIKKTKLKTGEVIFFSSDRDKKATNIFMMTSEGEIIKQVTNYNWGEYAATAISPDSNQLLFYQALPGYGIDTGMDIYIYKIKEDTIIGPITQGHPGNFSPDGNKFVFHRHKFTMEGGYESVYLYDLKSNSEIKLTEDGKTSFYPQISPDGNYICYETSNLKTSPLYWQLHLMNINGNYLTALTQPLEFYWAGYGVFTPDGKSVVFFYNERSWCYDICKIDIVNKEIKYITQNRFNGRYDTTSSFMNPNVSKDGNKVYFYSYYSNAQYKHPIEIYTINIDGSGLKRLTNNDFWDSHPISGIVTYCDVE